MKKILSIFSIVLLMSMSAIAQNSDEEVMKIKTSAVCGMCKATIEKDMKFEKGVKSADLNVKSKILTVTYRPDKTSPEKLRQAVAKIGYDADDVPADPKAYDNLDTCCKKDAHQDEHAD